MLSDRWDTVARRFFKRLNAANAFDSAAVTHAGIEAAHMIRYGQFSQNDKPSLKQFAALAALLRLTKTRLQPAKLFATEPLEIRVAKLNDQPNIVEVLVRRVLEADNQFIIVFES